MQDPVKEVIEFMVKILQLRKEFNLQIEMKSTDLISRFMS